MRVVNERKGRAALWRVRNSDADLVSTLGLTIAR